MEWMENSTLFSDVKIDCIQLQFTKKAEMLLSIHFTTLLLRTEMVGFWLNGVLFDNHN